MMLGYFSNSWSFTRDIGQHLLNEVFERIREETRTSLSVMRVPKDIESLLFDELVVWIIDHCLLKRRVACIHNEENDSTRKDVRFPAVVMFQRNLWSHVSLSAQLSMQDTSAIMPSNQAREPKVCNLEYEI